MPVHDIEFALLSSLESPTRRLENAHLKIGYFLKMLPRYPLNNEIGNCNDVGEAYLWQMEKDNMNIPPELCFDKIKDSLPEKHRVRIQRIWESVIDKRNKLVNGLKALNSHWHSANKFTVERGSEVVVMEYGDKIPEQYKSALAVMIDPNLREISDEKHDERAIDMLDLNDEMTQGSEADSWRIQDSSLRNAYFRHDKEYITTLRLYYQMLLENTERRDTSETRDAGAEYVLPKDHSARKEIWKRNRYLRLIDAIHQSVSVAKTLHHQQPTGRMREFEKVPYINHPIEVIGLFLKDVMPFVIEKRGIQFDFVLMAFILALHDLDEDTSQSVDQVIEKVKGIAEKIDSSVDHDGVIKSGFGLDRDSVIERYIKLLWPEDIELLEESLKVISKSTPITSHQAKFAANTDRYFGVSDLANIIPVDIRGDIPVNINTPEEGTNKTFKEFPPEQSERGGGLKSDDPKLDKVLFNLRTIPGVSSYKKSHREEKRRYALMAKLLDRIHNLSTMDGMSYKNKCRYLRGTTSRLMAYSVLDHDSTKFSLFNILPDMLQVLTDEYEKFAADSKIGKHDLYGEKDDKYRAQLAEWKSNFTAAPLPEYWAQVEQEFHRAFKKRKTPSGVLGETSDGIAVVLGLEGVDD